MAGLNQDVLYVYNAHWIAKAVWQKGKIYGLYFLCSSYFDHITDSDVQSGLRTTAGFKICSSGGGGGNGHLLSIANIPILSENQDKLVNTHLPFYNKSLKKPNYSRSLDMLVSWFKFV